MSEYDTQPTIENLMKMMNVRFDAIDGRLDAIEARLERIESKIDTLNDRLLDLEATVRIHGKRITALENRP